MNKSHRSHAVSVPSSFPGETLHKSTSLRGYINPAVSALPPEILKPLNATDLLLLNIILDLCICTSKHSPTRASYAFPGLKWLAGRIGRCPTWVSESLNKLQGLGLIEIIHRRKVNGYWQTNFYRLAHQMLYYFHKGKEAIKALLNGFGFCRNIVSKTTLRSPENGLKKDFPFKIRGPDPSDEVFRARIERLSVKIEAQE